jgi:hypothetical protein
MNSAAEPPPAGLIAGVRRRHRRHLRRAAAGCVAAAAAIALSIAPVAHALQAGQPSGPATSGSAGPAPAAAVPAAAPGTVLAGCDHANVGQAASGNLPPSWRGRAGNAGPLSFLNLGGHSNISGNKLTLYVSTVVLTGLRPGATVVVRVPAADRQYLRFLYGPGDSLNSGTVYTMGSGEPGVTFVMCPPDGSPASSEPITDYYGGLLIEGARCVPVDVSPPGRARPAEIRLGACH